MIAGCGRFRRKVAVKLPSAVTSSRFWYQALRGLARSFSCDLPSSQVPGAFDVIGGKGLAVVPFDALMQPECQFGAILVPRPIGSQIRDDRVEAVLRHVLLVQDEIVEDAHHRDLGRIGRLFEDRHAGRTVPVVDFQYAARLLARTGAAPEMV